MRTIFSCLLLFAGLSFSAAVHAQQAPPAGFNVKEITPNKNTGITVYPIPVIGSTINLAFDNEPAGKYYLRLTDQAGKTVFTQTVITATGHDVKALNTDSKPLPGIYVLSITGPNGFKERDGVIVE